MFFASRVLLGATKLSALTSKRGNKNYFKGRGAKSLGYRGKKGRFTFDPSKFARISFIAPDLTGFPLKAYVAPSTPRVDRDGQPYERKKRPAKSSAAEPATPEPAPPSQTTTTAATATTPTTAVSSA